MTIFSGQNAPDGTSYAQFGQGDQTLFFIHGVGLNHRVWQPQIDYFAASHSLVVYDMLGHGSSPLPDENATLADYAAQLLRLLDHLQLEQVSIIGHSMGALVAVAFALAHPDRVTALVPMNIVYRRTADKRTAVEERANQVLQNGQITGIETALARWFADKDDPATLEKKAQVHNWMNQLTPVGYGRTYRLFAISDDAFIDCLDRLTMPVLYLTGENDPNSTPAMSQQMAAETPNGQAIVLPNEAHMMAYLHPQKVNSILEDFLK